MHAGSIALYEGLKHVRAAGIVRMDTTISDPTKSLGPIDQANVNASRVAFLSALRILCNGSNIAEPSGLTCTLGVAHVVVSRQIVWSNPNSVP
jgi:hypothetical protein